MYTLATFSRLDTNGDGTLALVILHTGDAGEKPIEQRISVNASVLPTWDSTRGQAMDLQTRLNVSRDFATLALPALGTVLDTTTALPTPPASVYGSYRAASAPFTPGATPQDVLTITGSATRTVRVTGTGLVSVQTTAGQNAWLLVKRATANTGGTSALVTAVPDDDSFLSATATVRQYTANPTAGTVIGSIWSGRLASPAPASAAIMPGRDVDLSRRGVLLSGVADVLSWNFGGAVLPSGLSVQAWVSWEEST